MEINELKTSRVIVITIKGQLAINEHPERLSQLVRERLDAGERLFLVNLEECQRMDSMGLGELVKSHVMVTREEGVLKLANVPLRLRGLLVVTKLAEAIEIFDDERTAIRSFGN